MTEQQSNADRGRIAERITDAVGRRRFIAAGTSLSAALIAGCTSESPTDGSADDDSSDEDESTSTDGDGNFRLLISDMPADIGDFDELNVTLDYARIFDGGGENEDEETESDGGSDDGGDEDEESGGEEGDESTDSEETDGDDADGGNETEEETEDETSDGVERKRDFYRLDLEGATVDLTQVVGDKAVSVFEGGLSPGSYEKIELHVESVEGIVDGEQATVKVPSEKLQITHPFEISADEPVDFVFDINVVKRGQGNDYNLTPVISESGVAGKDVEVEEVDEDEDEDEDEESEADGDDGEKSDESDSEDGSGTNREGNESGGNETDTGDE